MEKRVGDNYVVCFGKKILKTTMYSESKVDCRVRLSTGEEQNILLALEQSDEKDNSSSISLTMEALKHGYELFQHVMLEREVAKLIKHNGKKDILVVGKISQVKLLNNELSCEELDSHLQLPQNLSITTSDEPSTAEYTICWEKQDDEIHIDKKMCYEEVLNALELFKNTAQDDSDVSF